MPNRRAAPETVSRGSSTSSTESRPSRTAAPSTVLCASNHHTAAGVAAACRRRTSSLHSGAGARWGASDGLRPARGGGGSRPSEAPRCAPARRPLLEFPAESLEQGLARFYRGHIGSGRNESSGGVNLMADIRRLPVPVTGHLGLADAGCVPRHGQRLLLPPRGRARAGPREPRGAGQAGLPQLPGAEQCRRHALAVHEPYGVWGGLSEADTEEIIRGRTRRLRIRQTRCRPSAEPSRLRHLRAYDGGPTRKGRPAVRRAGAWGQCPCPCPWPPAGAGAGGSGLSTTALSVVSTIRAIDAALTTAERVTLTGSTTPSASRSP